MTRLVLASFNAHWGVRPRGMTSGPRGAAFDVDAVFRRLGADVVVLQESWRPDEGGAFVDDIAVEHGYHLEELPLARAVAGHRPRVRRPGTGTWGLAVLTRLPVVARRELPLGSVPRDPVGDRHALHLRLDVGGGAEMDLVAAHTSSRVPYGPLLHLRRLAPQLPDGERPAIVAGDMNIWGPFVTRALPRGWRRAVRGRTWPAHRPHSQIDHVLVNRRVEVVGAAVLPDQGSDHRPVRVQVRLLPGEDG